MRLVTRFFRLAMPARALVTIAALLQICAHVALRTTRLPRVDRLARILSHLVSWQRLDPARIAWAVAASSSHVGGTCLTQALAARVLCGWAGLPSRLVIGVRQRTGVPEFHAWLESAGRHHPADVGGPPFTALATWC